MQVIQNEVGEIPVAWASEFFAAVCPDQKADVTAPSGSLF